MPPTPVLPDDVLEVRIASIARETPDIKVFELDYGEQVFDFLPGQWIDLFVRIAGRWAVGGYSMTSSPATRGRIQLAIKAAAHHPVTRYLHQQAAVGEAVFISKAQGRFAYRPDMGGPLVLLGAGIGVTPLISILRYVRDCVPDVELSLIYSAREAQAFLFYEELSALSREERRLRCVFVRSRPDPAWDGPSGRIDAALLDRLALPAQALYFYCGARDFVEDMTGILRARGVAESRLMFEKWW